MAQQHAEDVASTTLEEPLLWSNSTLLKCDLAEAVAGLQAASNVKCK